MWKTKAAAPHRAAAFLVVLDDLECPPRCSGHIQRKNYFKFRVSEKSADFPEPLFHKWGCNWQRQMPRYPFRLAASRQATFPKGTAFGGGGKVSGRAKGPILEGAVERSETGGVLLKTKRTSSEEPVRHGRGSKFRTHGTRFWRPLLYQLSYTPNSMLHSLNA